MTATILQFSSRALRATDKAVLNMPSTHENVPFSVRYKDNYECRFYALQGTLREMRRLEKLCMEQPTAANWDALMEVSKCLEEMLND